jgi:hypothetical protein
MTALSASVVQPGYTGLNNTTTRPGSLSGRGQCGRTFQRYTPCRRPVQPADLRVISGEVTSSSKDRAKSVRTIPAWSDRERILDKLIMTQGYNRELGRPFRRTVYNLDDWKKHRQENRHLKHLGSLPRSEVIAGLIPPTLLCAASASLVCAFETAREVYPTTVGLLPSLLIDSLPFELTSAALGLLLVFRTEASYARWLDARKLLTSVQGTSANAARSAVVWFNKEDQDLSAAFVRWSKAFFKTLQVRTHP